MKANYSPYTNVLIGIKPKGQKGAGITWSEHIFLY